MRNALIYVHHEPLAHLFLTYGISASDLLNSQQKLPEHLLPVSYTHLTLPTIA